MSRLGPPQSRAFPAFNQQAAASAAADDDAPAPNGTRTWNAAMSRDLFNVVGGSIRRVDDGKYLVAFTSVADTRAWNARASSYIFEVDATAGDRGSGEPVWAKLALPVPEYDVGERNGYRFTPWRTLNGEKASCPFD